VVENCSFIIFVVKTVTSVLTIVILLLVRFHAYTVTHELELYELSTAGNRSSLVARTKVFGGIPDGAGVREDVMLVFEELEEARNNLTHIRSITKEQNERLLNGMKTICLFVCLFV